MKSCNYFSSGSPELCLVPLWGTQLFHDQFRMEQMHQACLQNLKDCWVLPSVCEGVFENKSVFKHLLESNGF
jgi:hypothetical protein